LVIWDWSTYNIRIKGYISQAINLIKKRLDLYRFLVLYLDMVKEIIRSVMLLVVLLTDSGGSSLTKFGKVKNNMKKSLTCMVYM
jgi:hypothetical protein